MTVLLSVFLIVSHHHREKMSPAGEKGMLQEGVSDQTAHVTLDVVRNSLFIISF